MPPKRVCPTCSGSGALTCRKGCHGTGKCQQHGCNNGILLLQRPQFDFIVFFVVNRKADELEEAARVAVGQENAIALRALELVVPNVASVAEPAPWTRIDVLVCPIVKLK